jgi:Zn-finger nucleic acid-binding protein
MIGNCPKCERESLVNHAHGTLRCPRCEGMFVPQARVGELLADGEMGQATTPVAPQDADAKGGQCPADRTIMSRTTVDVGGRTLHLERCSSCHGVWFDAGEWAALASAHLLDNLDQLWTAEWRARHRREREQAEYASRVKALFGEELYGELLAVAHKLKDHPRRSQALAILREESQ